MANKYQEYRQKPELLIGRFENGFPLLYPWDTVKVSSRWTGTQPNPLEGRLGYVESISHGVQSLFNRDYLIVGLAGGEELGNPQNCETWMYTLDLVNKDETTKIASSVLKQFGCLLYIDDRVMATTPSIKGRTGTVRSLHGTGDSSGGWLGLQVIDELTLEKIKGVYAEINRKVVQSIKAKEIPEGFAFDDFIAKAKRKNPEVYHLLEQQGKTRKIYEGLLREELYKRQLVDREVQRELSSLKENLFFDVSSKDVELVERFPPNDLFGK